MFCIPKHLVNMFLDKIKSGEISPDKLNAMTSEQRRTAFASFLGEENAKKVNALFESKLLLKSQQQGIINWAKQVTGIKKEVQRDILSKVNKMTEVLKPKDMNAFLSDLAAQRLGLDVTIEEAGRIADLAKTVADKKALVTEEMPNGSPERLAYGEALTLFKDYVGSLKEEASRLTTKEFLTSPGAMLERFAGTTKSILSSLDNSFFGRQGLVSLVTNPDIWAKNFAKSWGDIAAELKGVDAMLPIKADIFSRKNAINGVYKAQGLDIGLETEEAFPSSIPEKIPLFKRLYKASESAFNGAALRMRADLADRIIAEAEAAGISPKDKEAGIGRLVNSMTGRGKLDISPETSNKLNIALFSVKWIKSQFDVLTAHQLDKKTGSFARKKARENLLKLIAYLAGVLGIAKLLDPDSVDLDPRSNNFGKIMLGKKRQYHINITAGMNGLITLAARITPTMHNGKWGVWKKTGDKYTNLWRSKYGEGDVSDLFFDFMKGKASPTSRLILDLYRGKNMVGEKLTPVGVAASLAVPLPVQNLYEMAKNKDSDALIAGALLAPLDFIGVGSTVKEKRKKKLAIR